MRIALAVALLLTGLAGCRTAPPDGRVPPVDTIRYTAPLLRRLAEAVDGYRDGKDRFVVASLRFPHKVAGVFLTREEAEFTARRESSGAVRFAVFGPYRTVVETTAKIPGYVDSVVAYLSDGQRRTYNGLAVDALFWSLPAFDKFIVPYFTAHYGVNEAKRQRDLYIAGKSPLANSQTVPHYRSSF